MRKRVLVALAAAAMLVLLPTAAWAHHPEITAELDCDGKLTWTATAWDDTDDPKARTHNDVKVFLIRAGEDDELIGEGEFTPENGFTFSGEFELGLDAGPVRVAVKVDGPWGNGVDPKPEDDVRKTGEITAPTDCQTTTTKPEDTTTTTKPEDTTTTTQPEDTTTTTQPEETTTTVAPTTTLAPPSTAPPAAGGGLPLTGASTAPVLLSIAAGLIAAGGTAVYLARRRSGAGAES
jgi:hypothetical protein